MFITVVYSFSVVGKYLLTDSKMNQFFQKPSKSQQTSATSHSFPLRGIQVLPLSKPRLYIRWRDSTPGSRSLGRLTGTRSVKRNTAGSTAQFLAFWGEISQTEFRVLNGCFRYKLCWEKLCKCHLFFPTSWKITTNIQLIVNSEEIRETPWRTSDVSGQCGIFLTKLSNSQSLTAKPTMKMAWCMYSSCELIVFAKSWNATRTYRIAMYIGQWICWEHANPGIWQR